MDASENLKAVAAALVAEATAADKSLATAESCTGGWIAKAITDIPGSSACFGYGITSYSNAAKMRLLGVREATLAEDGAVSEATVVEMAEGVLELSAADLSVSVSGIAGPDGGSEDKPVGTVWLAWSMRDASGVRTATLRVLLAGDREAVRAQTVRVALDGLMERVTQNV